VVVRHAVRDWKAKGRTVNLYERLAQPTTATAGDSTPGRPAPPEPRTVLTKMIETTDEERAGILLDVLEP
jgi:hypothetical protein